jgi:DNA-binding CsgD family transcriptional regulator
MPRRQQLITQVPGSVTVGDRVKYDGDIVEVIETGLPGEYGPRVAIRRSDGSEIVTTPNLDHHWGRERNRPLPSLTELLYSRPLSDEQRQALEQVRRRAVGRVSQRAHMVLLSARGYTVEQIAEIFGLGEDAVRSMKVHLL